MRAETCIISLALLGAVSAQLNAAQQHFSSLCPSAHEQSRATHGVIFTYYCNAWVWEGVSGPTRNVDTAADCALLCTQNDVTCTGAIWNANTRRCYLTTSSAQPIIDRNDYPWWLFMSRGEPEPTQPPEPCPPGFHLSAGQCVPDKVTEPPSCPEGTIWDGTDCARPERPSCDDRLQECETAQGRCEDEKETCETSRQRCDEDKGRCEGARSTCETERTTCREEKNRCDSQSATCEAERGNFRDERNRCEGDKATCEAERGAFRDDKNRCEGQLATCETERGNCLGDKSRCEGDKTVCEADRSRCRDEKSQCEGQKATCDTQKSACQRDKGTCETERRTCQTQSDGLNKRIGDLERDLNKCRADLEAARRPTPPQAPATCPGAARGTVRNVSGVNFRLYCNAATHGTAWQTVTGITYDACLAQCAARPQCVQFDYKTTGTRPCYMKTNRISESGVVPDTVGHGAIRI